MARPVEPIYTVFGRKVREQRDALDWSQERLGRELHPPMTRASVANIEAAQQRVLLHTALEIAAVLKVSLPELLGEAPAHVNDAENLAAELASKLPIPAKRAKSLASEIAKSDKGETT